MPSCAWLDQVLHQVPPQSATGKALFYLHEQWDKLMAYLQDGRLEIDNNGADNAIRPFVLGRKNWLFSDSVRGVCVSVEQTRLRPCPALTESGATG